MSKAYLGPIGQGFGVFLLLAAAIWLPYLIWQYRRYGRVAPRRVLVQTTFLLYLICAWALVLLPLPDPASLRAPTPVNLIPFQWWADTLAALAAAGGGWRSWLTNGPLLVRIFNVALTVPLGIYLRRWYGRGLTVTTLAGLGLSLAFELTQLTGIWGWYAVRYRSFDVDDLIANTGGAALGWALAPLVGLLPARHRCDDLPVSGSPSPMRRLVALIVDSLCWVLAYLTVLSGLVLLVPASAYRPQLAAVVGWTITFAVVFVAVPVFSRGATPGQALLRLGVVDRSAAPPVWWRLLVRSLVIWLPVVLLPVLGEPVDQVLPDEPGWTLLVVLGLPAAWLVLLGLVALVRADRRSLPDLIAGTRVRVVVAGRAGAGT